MVVQGTDVVVMPSDSAKPPVKAIGINVVKDVRVLDVASVLSVTISGIDVAEYPGSGKGTVGSAMVTVELVRNVVTELRLDEDCVEVALEVVVAQEQGQLNGPLAPSQSTH